MRLKNQLMLLCFFALTVVISVSISVSNAQMKYRCGNSFQDKPCTDGKGSVIGKSNANHQVSENSSKKETLKLDSECSKKGNDALKIIWKRDGGALQEDLLANEHSASQRGLIADVYANRGNAIHVRQKIEQECMAEKEMPMSRQKMMKQMDEEQDAANLKEQKMPMTNSSSSDNNLNENIKQNQCARFQTQLKIIKSELKAGGSGSEMDAMNTQLRKLEKDAREQKCN
jgi:hypothetical protein